MQYWFRKSLFQAYRFLKHPRKLKQNRLLRWFARHFLDKQVWKPTQHTMAGGVAIGSFITLQLLPIQMPTATILCALFRVNIPIALVLCWISNPVTVPFLAALEYKIGKWFLSMYTTVPTTPFPKQLPESFVDVWIVMKEHAPVMLAGGVVLGAVCALLSYLITWLMWGLMARSTPVKKLVSAKAEQNEPMI